MATESLSQVTARLAARQMAAQDTGHQTPPASHKIDAWRKNVRESYAGWSGDSGDSCPVCHGVKWVSFDLPPGDPYFGRSVACPVCHEPGLQRQAQTSLLAASALLPDAIGLTLDDILDRGAGSRAMIAQCRRMIERPFGMLTLWGGPGAGKSLALKVLVNAWISRGLTAAYLDMSDLLDYLRDGFDDQRHRYTDRLRAIREVRFLAVDELDKASPNSWAMEQFFKVLNRRYELGRNGLACTALAMNRRPDDWLPDYAISRLRFDMYSPDGWAIVANNDDDARPAGL